MLIYDDQSQYVYENKRSIDKMTAEESDIYGDMTWILPKNSGYDQQFALTDTFGAGFDDLHGENLPLAGQQGGFTGWASKAWLPEPVSGQNWPRFASGPQSCESKTRSVNR
jgi:hypothetical protein